MIAIAGRSRHAITVADPVRPRRLAVPCARRRSTGRPIPVDALSCAGRSPPLRQTGTRTGSALVVPPILVTDGERQPAGIALFDCPRGDDILASVGWASASDIASLPAPPDLQASLPSTLCASPSTAGAPARRVPCAPPPWPMNERRIEIFCNPDYDDSIFSFQMKFFGNNLFVLIYRIIKWQYCDRSVYKYLTML
jgi:hypothetical protein